jgi:predicted nucleic acid-binding protein
MKVYLDNLETEAKLYIQQLIIQKKMQLVWSYILDFENSKNPFEERKRKIERWKFLAVEDVEENTEILSIAKELEKIGLKKIDALHVACAIYTKCNYFITTDKGILKKSKYIKWIEITDPISFIREVLDAYGY